MFAVYHFTDVECIMASGNQKHCSAFNFHRSCRVQCDQIRQFIGLWATFQSLW